MQRDDGTTDLCPPLDEIGGMREPVPGPRVIRADRIELEQNLWYWPGAIAPGYSTILAGKSKEGKGFVVAKMTATLSVGGSLPDFGPLPTTRLKDGRPWHVLAQPVPRKVLILCSEDRAADIRIRLEQHAADLSQVHVVSDVVTLDGEGLEWLGRVISRYEPEILVVDPLFQYTPSGVRESDPKSVRKFMAPLDALMKDHGVALVAVMHTRKTGNEDRIADPKEMIAGSHQWVSVARNVLFVVRDARATREGGADGPTVGTLHPAGSNLGRWGDVALGYLIDDDGLRWTGPSDKSLEDCLLSAQEVEPGSGALGEAGEFYRTELAGGVCVPAAELKRRARDLAITDSTLNRAKKSLSVASFRARGDGTGRGSDWVFTEDREGQPLEPGRWYQYLADQVIQTPADEEVEQLEIVENLGPPAGAPAQPDDVSQDSHVVQESPCQGDEVLAAPASDRSTALADVRALVEVSADGREYLSDENVRALIGHHNGPAVRHVLDSLAWCYEPGIGWVSGAREGAA